MAPSLLGIRTCIYRVSDIVKAKNWYSHAFGLTPSFDEPFYVGFSVGTYELGLQPEEQKPLSPAENVLCYWSVKDVPAMVNHLILEGASLHEKPQDVGGGIIVASVRDPWNNVIGLIYDPTTKF
jgi:predicted enzyme related to lactoylglutathione lyase